MQENINSITEMIMKTQLETYKKQQELNETMELVRNYKHVLSKKVNSLETINAEKQKLEKELKTKKLLM